MYGRNIKKYGKRKIVPPANDSIDSHNIFDNIVKGEKIKQWPKSPFGSSSDSSHNSNNLSPCAAASDISFKGPITRKKTLEISKSLSRNESSHSTSQHVTSNSSALFNFQADNSDSISLIPCSPAILRKKGRRVLKDVNAKPVTKQKSKPAAGVGKKPESKKQKSKPQGKENLTHSVCENLPNFEEFDNYEFNIQEETPTGHTCSTPKIQQEHPKINVELRSFKKSTGHTVADSPCNVSNISGDGSHPLSFSCDDDSVVHVAHESHNITFRKSNRNVAYPLRTCRKDRLDDSTKTHNSSDSRNFSEDSISNNSSFYQIGDISEAISLNSANASENYHPEEDESSEFTAESLLTSFHEMLVFSDSIHEKLGIGDENISKRLTRSNAAQEVKVEENSVYNSSQSLFDDSDVHPGPGPGPSLSQIAEDEEEEDDEEDTEEEEDSDDEEEDTEEEEEDNKDKYKKSEENGSEKSQNITSSSYSSPSSGGKSDVTLFQLAESLSFYEKLSNSSICDTEVSAEERVLSLCNQEEPIPFSACISSRMMSKCVKIGEGVYGEVFRSFSDGHAVALKIIPIQGNFDVNDCPQKNFDEILPEIVIAKELSDLTKGKSNQTGNFCQVKSISCVKGRFPDQLLEQWDEYSERKHSENDRPDIFPDDQLFIVFEFFDGGCALENFKFSNHREAYSVLRQVVFALAVAEEELEFEHRDLHIGNVLVRPCEDKFVSFKVLDTMYEFPSEGVFATIIDFTISRLKKDDCAVFFDVATDEGLFEGKGDFQFDVYRDMREENGNDWQKFCPHSNVLWVNYLCKKLTTATKYKETGRAHRDVQRHLRCLVDSMLDYDSCTFLIEDESLWNVE